MVAFVDSTILIDILRNYSPAIAWLNHQSPLSITPIVYMELIAGARHKANQQKAVNLLTHFQMVYLTATDMDWSMQQQLQYALSHGIGMMDCLIASVSYRLQVPLYTGNLKHFTPLLDSLAQKPY